MAGAHNAHTRKSTCQSREIRRRRPIRAAKRAKTAQSPCRFSPRPPARATQARGSKREILLDSDGYCILVQFGGARRRLRDVRAYISSGRCIARRRHNISSAATAPPTAPRAPRPASMDIIHQQHDVFERALSFLGAADLLAAAAVCKAWRAATRSEHLWRSLCSRDWRLTVPVSPPCIVPLAQRQGGLPTFTVGEELPSFREAWKRWFLKYHPYRHVLRSQYNTPAHSQLYARAANCWMAMREVEARLNDGFQLREPLADHPLPAIPFDIQLLLQFHDGQDISLLMPLFGSFQYYDRNVLCNFLPWARIRLATPPNSPYTIISLPRPLYLSSDNRQLLLRNRSGVMYPAAPESDHPLLAWLAAAQSNACLTVAAGSRRTAPTSCAARSSWTSATHASASRRGSTRPLQSPTACKSPLRSASSRRSTLAWFCDELLMPALLQLAAGPPGVCVHVCARAVPRSPTRCSIRMSLLDVAEAPDVVQLYSRHWYIETEGQPNDEARRHCRRAQLTRAGGGRGCDW